MDSNQEFSLYKDMKARTNGEIYIGVVGPVRTGKSTFIKRFMDLCVLPQMENEHVRARAKDELPQSAAGTTIMTTEPKFIPSEAALIYPMEDVGVKVRLIDCVGFMVEGASGHVENEKERMVKTPWSQTEIPFTKAAEIGTKKGDCGTFNDRYCRNHRRFIFRDSKTKLRSGGGTHYSGIKCH